MLAKSFLIVIGYLIIIIILIAASLELASIFIAILIIVTVTRAINPAGKIRITIIFTWNLLIVWICNQKEIRNGTSGGAVISGIDVFSVRQVRVFGEKLFLLQLHYEHIILNWLHSKQGYLGNN